MLLHFACNIDFGVVYTFIKNADRIIDSRKLFRFKLNIDHWSDYLNDGACAFVLKIWFDHHQPLSFTSGSAGLRARGKLAGRDARPPDELKLMLNPLRR